MTDKNLGQFKYKTVNGWASGEFNLYQGTDGFIYLCMGYAFTVLPYKQVCDLGLDLYSLDGFNIDDYHKAYNL